MSFRSLHTPAFLTLLVDTPDTDVPTNAHPWLEAFESLLDPKIDVELEGILLEDSKSEEETRICRTLSTQWSTDSQISEAVLQLWGRGIARGKDAVTVIGICFLRGVLRVLRMFGEQRSAESLALRIVRTRMSYLTKHLGSGYSSLPRETMRLFVEICACGGVAVGEFLRKFNLQYEPFHAFARYDAALSVSSEKGVRLSNRRDLFVKVCNAILLCADRDSLVALVENPSYVRTVLRGLCSNTTLVAQCAIELVTKHIFASSRLPRVTRLLLLDSFTASHLFLLTRNRSELANPLSVFFETFVRMVSSSYPSDTWITHVRSLLEKDVLASDSDGMENDVGGGSSSSSSFGSGPTESSTKKNARTGRDPIRLLNAVKRVLLEMRPKYDPEHLLLLQHLLLAFPFVAPLYLKSVTFPFGGDSSVASSFGVLALVLQHCSPLYFPRVDSILRVLPLQLVRSAWNSVLLSLDRDALFHAFRSLHSIYHLVQSTRTQPLSNAENQLLLTTLPDPQTILVYRDRFFADESMFEVSHEWMRTVSAVYDLYQGISTLPAPSSILFDSDHEAYFHSSVSEEAKSSQRWILQFGLDTLGVSSTSAFRNLWRFVTSLGTMYGYGGENTDLMYQLVERTLLRFEPLHDFPFEVSTWSRGVVELFLDDSNDSKDILEFFTQVLDYSLRNLYTLLENLNAFSIFDEVEATSHLPRLSVCFSACARLLNVAKFAKKDHILKWIFQCFQVHSLLLSDRTSIHYFTQIFLESEDLRSKVEKWTSEWDYDRGLCSTCSLADSHVCMRSTNSVSCSSLLTMHKILLDLNLSMSSNATTSFDSAAEFKNLVLDSNISIELRKKVLESMLAHPLFSSISSIRCWLHDPHVHEICLALSNVLFLYSGLEDEVGFELYTRQVEDLFSTTSLSTFCAKLVLALTAEFPRLSTSVYVTLLEKLPFPVLASQIPNPYTQDSRRESVSISLLRFLWDGLSNPLTFSFSLRGCKKGTSGSLSGSELHSGVVKRKKSKKKISKENIVLKDEIPSVFSSSLLADIHEAVSRSLLVCSPQHVSTCVGSFLTLLWERKFDRGQEFGRDFSFYLQLHVVFQCIRWLSYRAQYLQSIVHEADLFVEHGRNVSASQDDTSVFSFTDALTSSLTFETSRLLAYQFAFGSMRVGSSYTFPLDSMSSFAHLVFSLFNSILESSLDSEDLRIFLSNTSFLSPSSLIVLCSTFSMVPDDASSLFHRMEVASSAVDSTSDITSLIFVRGICCLAGSYSLFNFASNYSTSSSSSIDQLQKTFLSGLKITSITSLLHLSLSLFQRFCVNQIDSVSQESCLSIICSVLCIVSDPRIDSEILGSLLSRVIDMFEGAIFTFASVLEASIDSPQILLLSSSSSRVVQVAFLMLYILSRVEMDGGWSLLPEIISKIISTCLLGFYRLMNAIVSRADQVLPDDVSIVTLSTVRWIVSVFGCIPESALFTFSELSFVQISPIVLFNLCIASTTVFSSVSKLFTDRFSIFAFLNLSRIANLCIQVCGNDKEQKYEILVSTAHWISRSCLPSLESDPYSCFRERIRDLVMNCTPPVDTRSFSCFSQISWREIWASVVSSSLSAGVKRESSDSFEQSSVCVLGVIGDRILEMRPVLSTMSSFVDNPEHCLIRSVSRYSILRSLSHVLLAFCDSVDEDSSSFFNSTELLVIYSTMVSVYQASLCAEDLIVHRCLHLLDTKYGYSRISIAGLYFGTRNPTTILLGNEYPSLSCFTLSTESVSTVTNASSDSNSAHSAPSCVSLHDVFLSTSRISLLNPDMMLRSVYRFADIETMQASLSSQLKNKMSVLDSVLGSEPLSLIASNLYHLEFVLEHVALCLLPMYRVLTTLSSDAFPENEIDSLSRTILSSHILSFCIMSLSSKSDHCRSLALVVLEHCAFILEYSSIRLFDLLAHVFDLITCGLSNSPSSNIPSLTHTLASFLSHAVVLLGRSSHPAFEGVVRILVRRPQLDSMRLPGFLDLFFDTSSSWNRHQQWIVDVLRASFRSFEDYKICQNLHVSEILMSSSSDDLTPSSLRRSVLETITRMCSFPGVARDLLRHHGLLDWLVHMWEKSLRRDENEFWDTSCLVNLASLSEVVLSRVSLILPGSSRARLLYSVGVRPSVIRIVQLAAQDFSLLMKESSLLLGGSNESFHGGNFSLISLAFLRLSRVFPSLLTLWPEDPLLHQVCFQYLDQIRLLKKTRTLSVEDDLFVVKTLSLLISPAYGSLFSAVEDASRSDQACMVASCVNENTILNPKVDDESKITLGTKSPLRKRAKKSSK